MQRRLYEELGGWAVMANADLAQKLAELDEADDDLSAARALFARALETPGGLKIQTIHAFCEKLLRRFPLEAAVSPGFQVLEASAAAEVSASARDDVARYALEDGDGPLAKAYAYFSVELDWRGFNAMFATFEARRSAIAAYVEACEPRDGVAADLWGRCGFDEQRFAEDIEAEAVARLDWAGWRNAAEALAAGSGVTDQPLAAALRAVNADSPFAEVWALLLHPGWHAARQAGHQRHRRRCARLADPDPGRAGRRRRTGQGGADRRGHPARHHPGPRLWRALRGGQGARRRPRLRRPDRAHSAVADGESRRGLGALQAGRRYRPRAAGRSPGHRAGTVGHPARPDRGILRRGRIGPCSHR